MCCRYILPFYSASNGGYCSPTLNAAKMTDLINPIPWVGRAAELVYDAAVLFAGCFTSPAHFAASRSVLGSIICRVLDFILELPTKAGPERDHDKTLRCT